MKPSKEVSMNLGANQAAEVFLSYHILLEGEEISEYFSHLIF